jgi:hypothetical protein
MANGGGGNQWRLAEMAGGENGNNESVISNGESSANVTSSNEMAKRSDCRNVKIGCSSVNNMALLRKAKRHQRR